MKYYIVSRSNWGSICNYMLLDLKKLNNVDYIYIKDEQSLPSNRVFRKLTEIITDVKFAIYTQKHIFDKIIKISKKEEITLILTNEALQYIPIEVLEKAHQNHIKVDLLLIDPLSANYSSVSIARNVMSNFKFDTIITFDPADAESYGLIYSNCLYSHIEATHTNDEKDIYYIGNVKDRFDYLSELRKKSIENNVTACIKLSGLNESQKKNWCQEEIIDGYYPYENVINDIQNAHCIFDLTQKGQSGITLRYYEAVVYNKKLITNNSNIKKLPFYDSNYMKIINSLDDIDWEWAKNYPSPEFNYNNEFSPINLIDLF